MVILPLLSTAVILLPVIAPVASAGGPRWFMDKPAEQGAALVRRQRVNAVKNHFPSRGMAKVISSVSWQNRISPDSSISSSIIQHPSLNLWKGRRIRAFPRSSTIRRTVGNFRSVPRTTTLSSGRMSVGARFERGRQIKKRIPECSSGTSILIQCDGPFCPVICA